MLAWEVGVREREECCRRSINGAMSPLSAPGVAPLQTKLPIHGYRRACIRDPVVPRYLCGTMH